MTDAIRKTVKPAHPGGRIPDPEHGNQDIPQDGLSVIWNHYWIGRQQRGEILVIEPETPAVAGSEAADALEA